ncbi:MAG: LTA synthase family protein [Dysgonamonadaceae bacterium]|jgi:phosphoglycerol transferase MdoB-like AlkP superfamily enzyme|nr:LTA synthase family protein [Dysgonamonadaceae bacterium]
MKFGKLKSEPLAALVLNMLLALALYYACRLAFYLFNLGLFPDLSAEHLLALFRGGLKFDVSALIYTNIIYILLQIIPFRFRTNAVYQTAAKWIFIAVNSIAIIANCTDIIYFRFSNRRTTASLFSEFKHENNALKVLGEGILGYWYIVVAAAILIFILYKLYFKPRPAGKQRFSPKQNIAYYAVNVLIMAVIVYCSIIGMRGGSGRATRPITISNANEYVNKSAETAIVLNTPFCIIRTLTKKVYANPNYFASEADAERVFSPIHYPNPKGAFRPLNVVILIIESFGKEYSGFFNSDLDGGQYRGYTPFADSLYSEGLTFKYSYCNGRKSIDAMPSILSSIPMFYEPFVLTHYSTDDISGVASILKEKGYYSAFFHGAPNGSMGFSSYARSAGYDDYFGMNEYGHKDLDGTWAVWDEEFLQFFAEKMGGFRQPFVTTVFTASSHHPFRIPARYEGRFPTGDQPIHKCIAYTDYSLRRFFEAMSKYDWYENTLFVLTADHTNQTSHDEYRTDLGSYSVPVLFYLPGGDLKGLVDSVPVQQIDIMPSILSILNYDKPYFAFGQDVFTTPAKDKFCVSYNNQMFQFLRGDYFMTFDGQKTHGVYDFKNDKLLKNNLLNKTPDQSADENHLKAMIQVYINRITGNRMRAE